MQIELVDNFKDFRKLDSVWNNLLIDSGNNYIQLTYEWLTNWWKNFGSGKKLFILIAKDRGKILGIAPLIIKKTGKFLKNTVKVSQLSFISDGFADNADFIVTEKREEVLRGFFDFLLNSKSYWDEIVLKQINDESPNYELIRSLDYEDCELRIDKLVGCPYLKISGDFESYYSSLKKKWTKEVDRKIKKIERERNITAEIRSGLSGELLDEIYQLNLERNRATRRKSIFLQKTKYKFIKDVAKAMDDKGWIKLFLMRDDGKLIAYSFSFDYNKTINRWNTSYNLDYRSYSPGNYLMKYVLNYCFDNEYNECNFMAGEESYKFNWASGMRENKIIILTKKDLKAKIINLYPKIRYTIKSKILTE